MARDKDVNDRVLCTELAESKFKDFAQTFFGKPDYTNCFSANNPFNQYTMPNHKHLALSVLPNLPKAEDFEKQYV